LCLSNNIQNREIKAGLQSDPAFRIILVLSSVWIDATFNYPN
jgi:hypothetical protein